MAASKSCLLDLPVELFNLVLSYLSDFDLINVRKAGALSEDSFQQLIRQEGRKLNFSRCYHLREEDLIEVLELGRDYITSVNVNHCHWLTSASLALISKLPKLQELHVVDCRFSALKVKELVRNRLSALSFNWDHGWMTCYNEKYDSYISTLFRRLKQLTIYIKAEMPSLIVHAIKHKVFRHCVRLEALTVYETSDAPHTRCLSYRHFQKRLLPNLSKLNLHLNSTKTNGDSIPEWIWQLFGPRTTLLNEVCLGPVSYRLLESGPGSARSALLGIATEEIPVVCLDSCDHSYPELPAIPKIWMDRRTPKCKVVSLQGLTLACLSVTSTLIAELGPQLQELNLRDCKVYMTDLLMGFCTVATNCTQLTKLDVTLNSSVMTNDDSNDEFLRTISQFKALKVLYVSVGLLSRSKNSSKVKTVSEEQNSSTEIFEESMRSSGMWRFTQSCMKIEDFRMTNDTWTENLVVCEPTLACISNWTKLKELHLVNIPTLGRGCFLPFITKNCPQLTNLYLANVCCEGTCNYMTSLIKSLSYATNLKDLSIIQDMELSSMLSNVLGKCQAIERVYLHSLAIKTEECHEFIRLLSQLPKLILVWVDAKSTTAASITLITRKIESLKRTSRPSLTYFVENKALSTALPERINEALPDELTSPLTPRSYKWLVDHWPHVHLELERYTSVCKNSSPIRNYYTDLLQMFEIRPK